MKATKTIPYIIILVLIIVVMLQRECQNCPDVICPETTDSIVFDYDIDTITVNKVVYLPKPYRIYDTILKHDTIFRTHADTVKAVKDYSLYRKYDLPLINDSTGKINFLVDVQFNQIAKYQLKGTIYDRKTVIEHHHYIMEEKRNKVFLGASIGYSIPDTSMLFAPELMLLTKKEHAYKVSYEPFRQIASFGMLWKIRLKK